jgi:hypothetical protein
MYVFFWVIPGFWILYADVSEHDPHGGWRPPCGSLPSDYLLCKRTHPYPVTLLPIGLGYSRAKPSPVWISQLLSNLVIILLLAHEDGTVFRNVGVQNTDAGELPRSKHTTYRTRRTFEIKIFTFIRVSPVQTNKKLSFWVCFRAFHWEWVVSLHLT